MITNNFKNAVLTSLSLYWDGRDYYDRDTTQVDLSKHLYFTDMMGELRRLNPHGDYQSDGYLYDDSVSVHCLFHGGAYPGSAYNRATLDYDNIEDLIASYTFFTGGGRASTTNQNSWHITSPGMLILGSGDTPPTKDDYRLDSWIPTTKLKPIAYGCTLPHNFEANFIGSPWATFYNSSDKNITVKEIGLIIDGYLVSKNDSGNDVPTPHTKYLLAREVLENPVIIKPQEGCTFNFTIE